MGYELKRRQLLPQNTPDTNKHVGGTPPCKFTPLLVLSSVAFDFSWLVTRLSFDVLFLTLIRFNDVTFWMDVY